jgi:hypothetical protein
MFKRKAWTSRELVLALAALAFVLLLHGAVPFLMVPTLGQAVWSMGFAQSMANGGLFDFYVHDFGIPRPAAIAFGLAGAWPASLLIRLGLHPADAYAGMVAAWLGLALWSAYRIAARWNAKRSTALLCAVAWMSMPIIWAHAGYSMLSIGIALLSFYFLAAFRLFAPSTDEARSLPAAALVYAAAAIIAVFMDGYTFMMFAAGSSIFLLYLLVSQPVNRPALLKIAVPIHIAGFSLAYFLFTAYIGKSHFEAHALDFFRAWGLDLSFIAIPTKGVLWLPDVLHFSRERSEDLYFGDASVWSTTFALPVLLAGLVAWWCTRSRRDLGTAALLVAAFAFYMSLGPSLKIDSTKSATPASQAHRPDLLMSPDAALGPTGSAWISTSLPGFNVMRASYRWSALAVFCMWLVMVIRMARTDEKYQRLWPLAICFVILLNLPDPQKQWQSGADNRTMFRQIDRELVSGLKHDIRPSETVLFIPWGNDFIANYLAPRSGFRTFNIGGDKNLAAAHAAWPAGLQAMEGQIAGDKAPAALKMLLDGSADVVVLPYFNMLWSPHLWPCVEQSVARLSVSQKETFRHIAGFVCPAVRRAELRPLVHGFQRSALLNVTDSTLYAAVRLRPEYAGPQNRARLRNALYENIPYPLVMGDGLENSAYILGDGWHGMEGQHVWSQAAATLRLPRPAACRSAPCSATLRFSVFGASPQRPVTVLFSGSGAGRQWGEKAVASSGDAIQVKIALPPENSGLQEVSISVPEAASPAALKLSGDTRVLGIALQRIDLSQ